MHASTVQAAYATHSGDAPGSVAAPTSMAVALYRAALGPLGSTEHYLAAFARMDATERMLPGWNNAAAFCTLGWMVLRRLWGELLAYLAGLLVLILLMGALAVGGQALPAPVLAGLVLALALLAFAVPGLYGDALVHRQVRRNIAAAVEAAPTMIEAMRLLERSAADRARLVAVVAGGAALVALLGVVSAFYLSWVQGRQAPSQLSSSVPVFPPMAEPHVALPPAVQERAAEPATAESPAAHKPAAAPELHVPAAVAEPRAGVTTTAAAGPAEAFAYSGQQAGAAVSQPTPEQSKVSIKEQAKQPSKQTIHKPVGESAPQRAETARRLYINVGLFAEPGNAQRTHARLQRAGLPSAVNEVVAANGRRLQRVRVGPFASSAEANAAVARVRALGLDAAAAAEKPAE